MGLFIGKNLQDKSRICFTLCPAFQQVLHFLDAQKVREILTQHCLEVMDDENQRLLPQFEAIALYDIPVLFRHPGTVFTRERILSAFQSRVRNAQRLKNTGRGRAITHLEISVPPGHRLLIQQKSIAVAGHDIAAAHPHSWEPDPHLIFNTLTHLRNVRLQQGPILTRVGRD